MDYWFKCEKCGFETQTTSTEEEIPKEISCINCFNNHKVIDRLIKLSVESLDTIDYKKKKQVEMLDIKYGYRNRY